MLQYATEAVDSQQNGSTLCPASVLIPKTAINQQRKPLRWPRTDLRSLMKLRSIARLIAALVLVFATYNPSGYSYYHWVEAKSVGFQSAGCAGRGAVDRWSCSFVPRCACWGSRDHSRGGLFGSAFVAGHRLGLGVADNVDVISWASSSRCWRRSSRGGVSWSHIRRRLTGQIDVDEIDNNRDRRVSQPANSEWLRI